MSMRDLVFQLRVETAGGEGSEDVFVPIVLRRGRRALSRVQVIHLKQAVFQSLGVPASHQEILGPLPSRRRLLDSDALLSAGVVPGAKLSSFSDEPRTSVNAGELFTTVGVWTARKRRELASGLHSPSDVLVLKTRHALQEYLASDGLHFTRYRSPLTRILVYILLYTAVVIAIGACAWGLWSVGRLSLPKPKVWFDIEKRILKLIMLQGLDEDIPEDVKEQLRHMEL